MAVYEECEDVATTTEKSVTKFPLTIKPTDSELKSSASEIPTMSPAASDVSGEVTLSNTSSKGPPLPSTPTSTDDFQPTEESADSSKEKPDITSFVPFRASTTEVTPPIVPTVESTEQVSTEDPSDGSNESLTEDSTDVDTNRSSIDATVTTPTPDPDVDNVEGTTPKPTDTRTKDKSTVSDSSSKGPPMPTTLSPKSAKPSSTADNQSVKESSTDGSKDKSDISEGPPTVKPTKGQVSGEQSESPDEDTTTKLVTPPVDLSTSYETVSADFKFKTSPPSGDKVTTGTPDPDADNVQGTTPKPTDTRTKDKSTVSDSTSKDSSDESAEPSTGDSTRPIDSGASSDPGTFAPPTPSIFISSTPPTVVPSEDAKTSKNPFTVSRPDVIPTTPNDEIGTTEKADINFCEKDKEYKSRVEEFCNELVFSIFMLNVDCRDTIGTTEFYRNCTEKLCKGDTPEQRCGLAFEYQASCTDGDIGSVQIELGIDCDNMRPSLPFSAFPSNAVSSETPTDASDSSTTAKDQSGETKSVSGGNNKSNPINRTTKMKPELPTTPRVPVSTDSSKEQTDITSFVPFKSESIGSATQTVITPPVLPTEEVTTEDPSDKSNESTTKNLTTTTGTPDPDADNVQGTTPKPTDTRTKDKSTVSKGPPLPTTLSPRSEKSITSGDDQSTTDGSKDKGDISEGPPTVKPTKDSDSDEQSSEDEATTGTPDPDIDNVQGTTPKPIDTQTKDKSTASKGPPLPTTLSPRYEKPSTSGDDQSTTVGSKDKGDISEGPPTVKPTKDSDSDEQSSGDEATTGTPDPDIDNVQGTTPKPIDTQTKDKSTASKGPPLPTTLSPRSEKPSTSGDDQSTTDGYKDKGDISEGPPTVKPTEGTVPDDQSESPNEDTTTKLITPPVDVSTSYESSSADLKFKTSPPDTKSPQEFKTKTSPSEEPSEKPSDKINEPSTDNGISDGTEPIVSEALTLTPPTPSIPFSSTPPTVVPTEDTKTSSLKDVLTTSKVKVLPTTPNEKDSSDEMTGSPSDTTRGISTVTPTEDSGTVDKSTGDNRPTKETTTKSPPSYVSSEGIEADDNFSSTPPLPETSPHKSSEALTDSSLTESVTEKLKSSVSPTMDGKEDKTTKDSDAAQKTDPTKKNEKTPTPVTIVETFTNSPTTVSPKKDSVSDDKSDLSEGPPTVTPTKGSVTDGQRSEDVVSTKLSTPPVDVSTSYETSSADMRFKTSPPDTKSPQNSKTKSLPKSSEEPSEKATEKSDEPSTDDGNDGTEPNESKPPTLTTVTPSIPISSTPPTVIPTKDATTGTPDPDVDNVHGTTPKSTDTPSTKRGKNTSENPDDKTKTDGEITTFSPGPSEDATEGTTGEIGSTEKAETNFCEKDKEYKSRVEEFCNELVFSIFMLYVDCRDTIGTTEFYRNCTEKLCKGDTPEQRCGLAFEYQASCTDGDIGSVQIELGIDCDNMRPSLPFSASQPTPTNTVISEDPTDASDRSITSKDPSGEMKSVSKLDPIDRTTEKEPDLPTTPRVPVSTDSSKEQPDITSFVPFRSESIGSATPTVITPPVLPTEEVTTEDPSDKSNESSSKDSPTTTGTPDPDADNVHGTTPKPIDTRTKDKSTASKGPPLPTTLSPRSEQASTSGDDQSTTDGSKDKGDISEGPPTVKPTKDSDSNEQSSEDEATTGTPDPDADNVHGTTPKPTDTRTRDQSTDSKGSPLPTTLAPKSEKPTTAAGHQPVKVSTLDGSKDKSDNSEGPPSVTPTEISVSDGQSKSSGEDTTTKLATPPVDGSTSSADFKFKTSPSDTKSQEPKTKKTASEEPSEKPSDKSNQPTDNGIGDGTEPIVSEALTLTPPTPSIPFSSTPPTVVPTEDTKPTSKFDILPTTPDEKDSSTGEISTEDPSDKINESDDKSTVSKGPPIPTTLTPKSDRPSRGSSTITPTENAGFKTDDGISTKSSPSEEIPSEVTTGTPDPDADNVEGTTPKPTNTRTEVLSTEGSTDVETNPSSIDATVTTPTPDPDVDNVQGTTPKPTDTRTKDKSDVSDSSSKGPPLPTTPLPKSEKPSAGESVKESTTDGSRDKSDISEDPPTVVPTKDSVSEDEVTTGTPDPDVDNVEGTTPKPTDTRTEDKSTASKGPPLPTTLSPQSGRSSRGFSSITPTKYTGFEVSTEVPSDESDESSTEGSTDVETNPSSIDATVTTPTPDPDVDNVQGTTPKPTGSRTKDKSDVSDSSSKGPPLSTTLSPKSEKPSTSAGDSVKESKTDGSQDKSDISEGPPTVVPTKDSVSEDEVTTGTPDPDVDNVEGTTPKPTDTRTEDKSTASKGPPLPTTLSPQSGRSSRGFSSITPTKDTGFEVSTEVPSDESDESSTEGSTDVETNPSSIDATVTTPTPDPDVDNVQGTTPKPTDTRTKDKSDVSDSSSKGPPLPTTLSPKSEKPSTSAGDSVKESKTDGSQDKSDISEGPPTVVPTTDSVSDEQSSKDEVTTGTPDPDVDNVEGTTPKPTDTRTEDKSTASKGPPLPTTLSPQSGRSSRGFSSITPTKYTGFEVSTEVPSDESDESSTEGSTDVETNPSSIDATVTTPTPDPDVDNVQGTTPKPTDSRTKDKSDVSDSSSKGPPLSTTLSPKSEKPSTSAGDSVKESKTDGSQDKSDISEGPPTVVPTKDSVSEDEVTTGTPDPDVDNVEGTTPKPTDTRTEDKSTASKGPPLPTTLSPQSGRSSRGFSSITPTKDTGFEVSTEDPSDESDESSTEDSTDVETNPRSIDATVTTPTPDPDVDNVHGTTPKPTDTRTKDKSDVSDSSSKGPPLPTTPSPKSEKPSTSAGDSVKESKTDGSQDKSDISEGPPTVVPTTDSVSDEQSSKDEVTTATQDPDVDNVEGTTPKPTDTRTRDGPTVSKGPPLPTTLSPQSGRSSRGFSSITPTKDTGFEVSTEDPSDESDESSTEDSTDVETNPPSIDATVTTPTPDPDVDNVHGTTPKPIDTRTKDKSDVSDSSSKGPPLPTTPSPKSEKPSTSAEKSVKESTTDGSQDKSDISEGPPTVVPTTDSVSDEQSSKDEVTTGTPDPDADNVHGTTPKPIDTRTKDTSTASKGPPLPTTLSSFEIPPTTFNYIESTEEIKTKVTPRITTTVDVTKDTITDKSQSPKVVVTSESVLPYTTVKDNDYTTAQTGIPTEIVTPTTPCLSG